LSLAKRVYEHAPLWLQNFLVSAYGLRLRWLRYGAGGREALARLRQSQWMSEEETRRYQLSSLKAVVSAATSDVPFYRLRAAQSLAIDPSDVLRNLPLLTKSDVQLAGRAMISDRYRGRALAEVHTGGTTGKPLSVFCDRPTLQRNYAFFTRFKEQAGIGKGDRIATFAGRTLVPMGASAPYWRHNRPANTLLFSSYHIGLTTIPSYVCALAEFAPAMIDSYPSSIEPIARYIVEQNITSVRPKAVVTSSETLLPSVRAVIERAFGCRVFDHYGSAEMVALITQCEAGTYHIVPEFGFVEVLDAGRQVQPGETGEIVATGFINPVMPLLRYATGDHAVMGRGSCSCGRAGQTIERIEGRLDDVIVTPEGNLVGRLDPIFKAVSSLHETRIVQDAEDHVRVEIVASSEFTSGMERALEAELRSRLGHGMRIDIVRVPSIERTASGKLRTTVNLVYPSRRVVSDQI
jgi:phenylacetate-CoA ligase